MAIERIPMERLSQLAKRNKEFRWPTRATRNRLEPICSPRFDPAFKITSTDNIFTLGSCFANSIAVELRTLGLKVFPEDIKKDIRSSGEREIPSRLIGEVVMQNLRKIDEVAFIRFASVYRRFEDINEFSEEVEKLTSD